jgi:hypothetical protein
MARVKEFTALIITILVLTSEIGHATPILDDYLATRARELESALLSENEKNLKTAKYLFSRALERCEQIYGPKIATTYSRAYSELVWKADQALQKSQSAPLIPPGGSLSLNPVTITQAVQPHTSESPGMADECR